MTIHLVVPGDPVGKGRPRFTRNGIAFTPAKTRNHEAYIKSLFVAQYPDFSPLEGPLEMEIEVGFPVPKSASKKRQLDMMFQREMPTKKPDIDNLVKAFADALNGLAYHDDSQIVSLGVVKRYRKDPQTVLKVRRVGDEP